MSSVCSDSASVEDKMARFGLDCNGKEGIKKPYMAPLISSYNDQIRPLLNTVDGLRHLNVMKEGINLPTIVVVGDQSSGKSSVLESLAGISLPRGQGICTRVPLVLRLQEHDMNEPEIYLEYQGKTVDTCENEITKAINTATKEIAGSGKGISYTPLTLVVKKKGVPDLTMIDLPGITRVPVYGQPDDIYEQISAIIMEYIRPKESVILNVLSATVDFPTCESIRMSQRVDPTGERTLAVVTKADKSPEGLLEKVTTDAVNIGLGYVCVRNRIGDETYEEGRAAEVRLFECHPLLSNMDKSIVGIPMLAQKLVQIQAAIISKCMPEIVKKINDKLNQNVAELNELPPNLTTIGDAMKAFMQILGATKESLKKLFIRGEFEEYQDEVHMHCTARMAEMLNDFSSELQSQFSTNELSNEFLMEEIGVLEEAKGIVLPNFPLRTTFINLLQRKVKLVADFPADFMHKMWNYIEDVVVKVLMSHAKAYPQLQSAARRATLNLISKMRDKSTQHVKELVEMEKLADYTSNPEYTRTWTSLMGQQESFMEVINYPHRPTIVNITGFGEVEAGHLRRFTSMAEQAVVERAFDMKMRVTAYWKIVTMRIVDSLALHLVYTLQKLVNHEMEAEIVNELMGPHMDNIEQMLEESASITCKRERLNRSIQLLRKSKEVVATMMDRASAHGNHFDFLIWW
eukprot:TRINITY_DN3931_c0_g1_i3.p1 TRINITY_DN3931_c0_g1~~TRINITY_DN3931_c0_g1_i3.p1  ORF type:complete len:688 (+),score=128.68 TRINITY_DN3931_c0_g1_i3:293-2356(+)